MMLLIMYLFLVYVLQLDEMQVLLFIRLRWIGLGAGVGGLLTASLLVTGVLIGHYNTDVLEAEQIETG